MIKHFSKFKIYLILGFAILLPVITIAGTYNSITTGWVANKSTVGVSIIVPTSSGDICQLVSNSSLTKNFFIPTKNLDEWNAFVANKPAEITLASCCACSAGYYLNASVCTACGSNSVYCVGDCSRSTVDVSYYSTGGTPTTRTGQAQCGYAYYCSSGVSNLCTDGYCCAIGNITTTSNVCVVGYNSATSGTYTCASGLYDSNRDGACESSQAGYYSPNTDYKQYACGANNKWSDGGDAACFNVSAGYYTTGGTSTTRTGESQCTIGNYCTGGVQTACSYSTFSNSVGATSCSSCLDGYCCNTGNTSSSSNICAAGYNSNTSGTYTCAAGFYDDNRDGICQLAEAGYYSPTNDYRRFSCGANDKWSDGGDAACFNVTAGYYTTGGTSTTRTGQSSCSAGYYCTAGVQTACGSNAKWSDGGDVSCFDATSGYYTTGGTSTTRTGQTQCTAGSYCTGGVIAGTCSPGYYCPAGSSTATQNACGAGTSNPLSGQGSVTACVACVAGYYNTTTGNASCGNCGAGYYCTGSTNHTACPVNTYNAGINGSSSSFCTACGDGYTSPEASTSSSACTASYCAASTVNGYTFSNINYGFSQAVSKSVTQGTCSGTANCNSGSVTITGESSSCSAGYFDINSSCADGCESRCGDGVCNNGETCLTCGDCGASCTCTPGATRTMYAALNSSCGTYSYVQESQTCQATGTWNGTYTLSSVPSNTTRTRYASLTSACGTYSSTSETQTCQSSGSFNGTYTLTSAPSASTRTMYASLTSACGTYSSTSESQTCQANGTYTGTYTLSSAPSASTRTRYAALTSACGTYSSTSESQTCQANGTYTGTYTLSSAPSSTTRTRYANATSACGIYGSFSETQTCQSSGSFNGTYTLSSASSADTRTRYTALTSACGVYNTTSETQTCQSNGVWSGSYSAVTPPSLSTRTRYANATSACGVYGAFSETQTCQSSGSFNGTYTLTSAPSADTRTRYAALTSACGTYSSTSQTQTCQSNGVWTGTYTLTSAPSASTRTRYANATSACGIYGSFSETQTCQSTGSFDGTYTLTSAPSADTRTRYAALTSACGTYSSTSQTQTCQSNGVWTGTYTLTSAPSASTRTRYSTATVSCGSTCSSETQTCQSTGAWNGTYAYSSCGIDACQCPAGTTNGWTYSAINYGSSASATKGACYRTDGGYLSATANCSATGAITITGAGTVPSCYSGYRYTSGSWYQSTYGCYYVCLLNCSAGSTSGYSYNALSSSGTQAVSKTITGGSCSATATCFDGSVTISGESCSCSAGYYYSSGSCVQCPANYYCTGGTSGATSCPSGSFSSVGSSSASSCHCDTWNSGTAAVQVWNCTFDCNNNMSDGCETSYSNNAYKCLLHPELACCGDGTCNNSETPSSCLADCGYCDDGICDTSKENSYSCYQDCGGITCSDNLDCSGTYGGYCEDIGFNTGYCDGGFGYCSGCSVDSYYCGSMCGTWIVQSYGNCMCY